MHKRNELPTKGTWVKFHNLPNQTSTADIRAVIQKRTGIDLPAENIALDNDPRSKGATVALEKHHVQELLAWALSEDAINGAPVDVYLPGPQECPMRFGK